MSDETKSPETGEHDEAQPGEAAAEQQGGKSAAPESGQEELLLQLEDARNKADEHWNQCLRLQAEVENVRRRAERDVEGAHKFALEKFALELLPVKDSLEMGLSAAAGDDETLAKLREGTELTLKMLTDAMAKFGIQEVDPNGQPFNPEYHQAMTLRESAEHPENTVIAVMQKGYILNDRLIRPAMVIVSKAPSGE